LFLITTETEIKYLSKVKKVILPYKGILDLKNSIFTEMNCEISYAEPYIKSSHDVIDLAQYCDSLSDKIVNELKSLLNTYHKTDHSERFYKINLGSWLLYFVHSYVDKYNFLESLKGKNISYQVLSYRADSFHTPIDNIEFLESLFNDHHQWSMYSLIAKEMNFNEIEITLKDQFQTNNCWVWPRNKSKKLKNTCIASFDSFLQKIHHAFNNKNGLLINSPGHKMTTLYVESLKKFSRYFPYNFNKHVHLDLFIDHDFRSQKILAADHDPIAKSIGENILKFIPVLNLEGMKKLENYIRQTYPFKVKNIYSAMGIYTNQPFLMYSAINDDSTLFYGQHGGGYGISKFHPSEEIEKSISDFYCTWGWNEKNNQKILPLGTAIIPDLKKIKMELPACLYLNTYLKYLYSYHFYPLPYFIESTFHEPIIEFIKLFSSQKALLIRDYPSSEKFKWDLTLRIKNEFKDIKFSNDSYSFEEQISYSKLHIIPNLASVHIYPLYHNKPSIVFNIPDLNFFKDEVRPLIEGMIEEKIFFTCHKQAAEHSIQISNPENCQLWWNNSKTQSIKNEYINLYAKRTDINKFYLSILNKSSS